MLRPYNSYVHVHDPFTFPQIVTSRASQLNSEWIIGIVDKRHSSSSIRYNIKVNRNLFSHKEFFMEVIDNSSMNNGERQWKRIEILGAKYVISTTTVQNSWKIFLSNLIEIWTETITQEIALERCQSLNMLLDVESFDFRETLDHILNDLPKYATEKSLDEIKLETCIDGIAFKFTLNLTKGGSQQLWDEITVRLYHFSMELQRRHEILLDFIKKKDEELSEYKLSGARLTRKNIETLPYNENIFENEISIDNSESEDCVTAFQSLMNLYNEFKQCRKSELTNDQKSLQQSACDPNHVESDIEQKAENTKAVETTLSNDINNDNDEQQPKIEVASITEHHPIRERNQSVTPNTEVSKQYGAVETRPCASESKINLWTKKDPKKRLTIMNVTNLPTTSVEQRSEKSKRLKVRPNIYDFIA